MIWREACANANVRSDMMVMSETEGLAALQAGTVDVLLDAIEMTPEAVGQFNLSVPLQQRALRAVVRTDDNVTYGGLLNAMWHSELGGLLLVGAIFSLLSAALMITVERNHRKSYFVERSTSERIEHGLWWSIVTFAAVGYGDVVPVTRMGRLVASCWMLFSVLLVALMGSVVAAEFTVSKLRSSLNTIETVRTKAVAVLTDRDRSRLEGMGALVTVVPSFESGIVALRLGHVEGFFVSDLDVMLHHADLQESNLKLLPGRLRDTFIAVAYRADLPADLERRLDVGLMSAVVATEWSDAAYFLGNDDHEVTP